MNGEVVIALTGYDVDGDALLARITTLPARGTLHQLSQVYSDYGYEPKVGASVGAALTLVSGSRNRVVYRVPANENAPAGAWAQFTYTVHDGTSSSEPGIVWVVPPHGRLVWSDFATGLDGWRVSSNGGAAAQQEAGGLRWESYSRGLLNRYVLATDAEVHVAAGESGGDLTRFYFEAPSKFLGNQVGAYGGSLHLTLGSSAGDFSAATRNPDAKVVVLECDTCDSGRGIRLARFAAQGGVPADGSDARISFALAPREWRKDPKSAIREWTAPSACELVEVLSGLTRVAVLGDLTRWYESVALDDFGLVRGSGVPIECADLYY